MKAFRKRVGRLCAGIGRVLWVGFLILYLLPLVVTLTNSFMTSAEVERNYLAAADGFLTMALVPERASLSQYAALLVKSPVYLSMFWNSVKIALPVVAGQTAVSALAAYAFTVLRFKGKEALFLVYILVMLLPLQVTLLPNYIVADWLHLTESRLAIILPAVFHPFGVFFLRQSLKSMPESCIEAAMIDGAGHGRIFWSIVLPMLRPGVAAAAMLILIDYWNLVDQAVLFLPETKKQPLSIFLAQISSEKAGLVFAGSVFYAIPVVLLFFRGQETLSAVFSVKRDARGIR